MKGVSWLGGRWQSISTVENHTVLLGEEKSTNVTLMEEAWGVWFEENVRIFSYINVVPMEEAQKASLEENIRSSEYLK
jgi:hypothetical protein